MSDSQDADPGLPGAKASLSTLSAAKLAAFAAGLLFLAAVVRRGWLSDDAFIAIRSVDHLVHGEGLVFNLGERVQSFTSPLWAFLCAPFFALTGDPYSALMAPGLLCSLALVVTVLIVWRRTPWKAATVLLALTASSAFLSFSTSGLENPLAHLLAALFVFERLENGRRPTYACFALAAALFLTRFDYALLVAPSVVMAVALDVRRSSRLAWPALAVIVVWFGFATFYYGFPFPNTAYAKLNTDIPLQTQIAQGMTYLVDSTIRDPIVLTVVALAGVLGFSRGMSVAARGLLLGVGIYVLYVIYIGGDFMSGRFLTTCYLVSVLVTVDFMASTYRWSLTVGAAVLMLFGISSFSDRRADPRDICPIPESGVVDERACYVEFTGLAQNVRRRKWEEHPYMKNFERAAEHTKGHFIVSNLAGMVSYANRDRKHIVEHFGLTEPLLARIEYVPNNPNWRIGHFYRAIPAGYLQTLRSGENVITDPCIHHLYDLLSPVIHGPLWSAKRLRDIWRLNTRRATCRAP